MKNLFNSIQLLKPKSNFFDLSHDFKFTADMGNLVPVLAQECIPGDKFKIGAQSLIRFAPLIAPVMHRMDVTIHYFFVPNRLVWPNWEDFIVDPQTTTSIPYLTISDALTTAQKKLADYMGVPPAPTGSAGAYVQAMPFGAYQLVYNEYYRDQNLIAPVPYQLTNGNNDINVANLLNLRKRAWMHDYFTSALPFAQKGSAVDIPLGDVELKNNWNDDGTPKFRDPSGGVALDGDVSQASGEIAVGGVDPRAYDPDGTLEVQPTTINTLRRAFKLQEFLERNARGGTRYIENILAHFGVRSSDKRLQRPEYITGVKSPIVVSEVLNTTGETGGLPQGNMAGHAISVQGGKSGSYYCEEHGYIIGIMSVMPLPAYQQGIPRTFNKFEPLDFFWPTFANIGEQEILKKEIYAYTPDQNSVFGYTPRYAEYRYNPSRVAGAFRNTLDYWHLGRIFATAPELNQTFIECNPDSTKRIFAVDDPDTETLYCHIYHDIKAIRPMPVFGTPTI